MPQTTVPLQFEAFNRSARRLHVAAFMTESDHAPGRETDGNYSHHIVGDVADQFLQSWATWEWKNFFLGVLGCVVFMYTVLASLNYAYSKVSYRKPVPLYLKWENDDIYDILWYAGARRNKSDKTNRSGLRFPTNSKGES